MGRIPERRFSDGTSRGPALAGALPTRNAVTFPRKRVSLTIGVNAAFEFNPPEGFVEPVLEHVVLHLLPAPVFVDVNAANLPKRFYRALLP